MYGLRRQPPGPQVHGNLPQKAPCLNPGCRRLIVEQETPNGRSRLFCSDVCRFAFHDDRKSLLVRAAKLEVEIQQSQGAEQQRLRRQLRHVRWHLLRYRPFQV